MLSIQKVSLAKAAYYIGLAAEDYYLKGGEAPGRWLGGGRDVLGLSGSVPAEAFKNLFVGLSPDGSQPLVQNAGQNSGYHKRCPAWDLTFSAPKSVSVVWSQASEEVRSKIEAAHRAAVEFAMSRMEQEAAVTRRGHGGKILEKANWICAAFDHGTNRRQEPQIHTHVLVFNLAFRTDGTTGSLRSEAIYENKMSIGALYRAHFAALLEKDLRFQIERVGTSFEIKGVNVELRESMSSRRKEILVELDRKGRHDAKSAESAALRTRKPKRSVDRDKLFARWKEIGKRHGWTDKTFDSLVAKTEGHRSLLDDGTKCVSTAVEKYASEGSSPLDPKEAVRAAAQEAQGRGLEGSEVLAAVERSLVQLSRSSESEPKKPSGMDASQNSTTGTSKAGPWEIDASIWEKAGFDVSDWKRIEYPRTIAEIKPLGLRLSVTSERVFPDVPLWNPIFDLKTSRLNFEIQKHDEFGPVRWRRDAGIFSAVVRDKYLFPEAIPINPLKDWHLPALSLHVDQDPFGLRAALKATADEILKFASHSLKELVEKIMAVGTEKDLQSINDTFTGRSQRPIEFKVAESNRELIKGIVERWASKGIRRPERNLILVPDEKFAELLNRLAQRERLFSGVLGRDSTMVEDYFVHSNDRVFFSQDLPFVGAREGELGTVTRISDHEMRIFLDRGTLISVPIDDWGNVRLGYALSYSRADGKHAAQTFVGVEGFNISEELKEILYRSKNSNVVAFARATVARRFQDELLQEIRKEDEESATRFKGAAHHGDRRNGLNVQMEYMV